MDIASAISAPLSQSANHWRQPRFFVGAMLIASTLSLVTGPLMAPEWWPSSEPQKAVGAVLLFTSAMHIGLTYFFYIDRDAREVLHTQWIRFYVAPPILLVGLFALFYLGGSWLRNLLWIWIGIWTLWHFQKQHYGIFCLIATARKDQRAREIERNAIYLGGIAGMCLNAIGYAGGLEKLGLPALAQPVLYAGFALQAVATGLALWVVYQDRQRLSLRHLFLLLFSSYWITLGFMPWGVAWMTSAAGHGYQYVVIMAMVGAASGPALQPRRLPGWAAPVFGVLVTAAIGLTIYVFADRILFRLVPEAWRTDALSSGLVGLSFAFTGVHYVLDAGIWRLSQPAPRQYVKRKLGFLFAS